VSIGVNSVESFVGRSVGLLHKDTYRVFQKKLPPKTFLNIFTSVKSFNEKFCKFIGDS